MKNNQLVDLSTGNIRDLLNNQGFKPVPNKLRVYHFPQVPCDPFYVNVEDEAEALLIISVLAKQHLFLESENIIPDYSNSIGVVMLDEDDNEWVEYSNDEFGVNDWSDFEDAVNEMGVAV